MAELKWSCIIFLAGFLSYKNFVLSNEEVPRVSEDCLRCICEAATNCDLNGKLSDTAIGPFAITKDYWIDAYRPVIWKDNPDDENAFVRCVTDPFCAAEAIEKYVKRYGKDCNKDGKMDCRDYHLMHIVGPECTGFLDESRIRTFNNCWDRVLEEENRTQTAIPKEQ